MLLKEDLVTIQQLIIFLQQVINSKIWTDVIYLSNQKDFDSIPCVECYYVSQ